MAFLNYSASTTAPRLASSSKDGTVRIWSMATRRTAFALGGHTACVNVVKWGGEGLIYTASSDRSVRVWDAAEVRRFRLFLSPLSPSSRADLPFLPSPLIQGKLVRILSDHAHWVTTMALSTDHVLRTGPFDHEGRKTKDDEEGSSRLSSPFPTSNAQFFPPRLSSDFPPFSFYLIASHS